MNEKQDSTPPASDADTVEITSQDVKNVIMLINNADIKVEQAELAVRLKIKLATYHNRLLAVEREIAETAAEKQ